MRDEQIRRYARHVLLPDVGGLGQTALLVASVRVDVSDPAAMIAATYLAAGGVGTLVVGEAAAPQIATLSALNSDSKIVRDPLPATRPVAVTVPAVPPWWPSSEHDTSARAFWCGGIAATTCMARIVDRRP